MVWSHITVHSDPLNYSPNSRFWYGAIQQYTVQPADARSLTVTLTQSIGPLNCFSTPDTTHLTADFGMEPYSSTLSPLYSPRTPRSLTVTLMQSIGPLNRYSTPDTTHLTADFGMEPYSSTLRPLYSPRTPRSLTVTLTQSIGPLNRFSTPPRSSSWSCVLTYSVGNVMQISSPPVIPPETKQVTTTALHNLTHIYLVFQHLCRVNRIGNRTLQSLKKYEKEFTC